MDLKFTVYTRIQKPVAEVFDAIYNPQKLSGYFTNGGATGSLDEGTTAEWAFADNPDEEAVPFPVVVERSVKNELIVLRWQGAHDELNRVEIKFETIGENDTAVHITESGWKSEDDLKASYGNCMGWSQMVFALKAYVEYGINLRKGAYEGMYKASDHK